MVPIATIGNINPTPSKPKIFIKINDDIIESIIDVSEIISNTLYLLNASITNEKNITIGQSKIVSEKHCNRYTEPENFSPNIILMIFSENKYEKILSIIPVMR